LKNVRAEDIEDVTERYVPMFTEERNSDTVKRIRISEKDTLFFVTLIEHKTKVDYNVSMQLLRYMVYIWEDYEKEMEKKKKGLNPLLLNSHTSWYSSMTTAWESLLKREMNYPC
ncbi:MAG: Rpn family recombination-promoting nuclease/putative transposase, partial [Lachnospiraceae bacterium]|nr:Rpn family recombination-promoting nuclease/putative transposase [Lachnospiraceae bacterium]